MKSLNLVLIICLALCCFPSCIPEDNSASLDGKEFLYETDELIKFIEDNIPNSSMELITNIENKQDDHCGPPSGCDVYSVTQNFSVNISECSTNVTDPCAVLASMTVTVCIDPGTGNVEVTFEEDLFGHDIDCITDHDGHTDDWECLANLVYNKAIEDYMPWILDFHQVDNNCEDGNRTVVSNYIQEVCVFPCIEKLPGTPWSVVRLVQCGVSTACCVEQTNWCRDDNGIIQTEVGPKIQTGSCSPALVPCKIKKGDGWPGNHTHCAPRNCISNNT